MFQKPYFGKLLRGLMLSLVDGTSCFCWKSGVSAEAGFRLMGADVASTAAFD